MKVLYAIILSAISFLSKAQSYPVFLDGQNAEWTHSTHTINDEAGDGNMLDLLQIKALNDNNYLYLYLSFYEEINLNANNNLVLLIDTDNNPTTGLSMNGIGAELQWHFGDKKGYVYLTGMDVVVRQSELGFRALPTVTSNKFEMAFNRNTTIEGVSLFQNNTIKIQAYLDEPYGDMLPELGQTFSYVFDQTPVAEFTELSLEKEAPSHLRLMTYNVENDGISNPEKIAYFERMIRAANPDIITLNECWDTGAEYLKQLLDLWIPLGGSGWHTSKVVSGNITASRYPIIKNQSVVGGSRLGASLIDLSEAFHSDIVVVNCHLKCCNEEGDNATRQYEVDGLINFIHSMRTGSSVFSVPENTPFVFMGDFNLVGDNQQLHTLINGDIQNTQYFGEGGFPDWNNSPMGDVISTGVNKNMAYTWRSDGGSYWPGRLDYIFYTTSQLVKQKSFIMETEYMSQDALTKNQLYSSDSRRASDHFPHVADFEFKTYNSIKKQDTGETKIKISANHHTLCINSSVTITQTQIFDLNGRILLTKNQKPDSGVLFLPVNTIKSGIYLLKIKTDKGFIKQKFFKP
ncbi:MAG: endonuclease/exonuclease/phosphatase family protein [Salinivirgaceae bacterium]